MELDEKKMQSFMYRVKNDRRFYIENFLKIRNKQAKLVDFKYNDAQELFEEKIKFNNENNKPHRYIVLKARQMGISTFTEAMIFHSTSTNELINSLIIAHEDKATQTLFNMSKMFYDELPTSIKPMKKYSNEKALVFENLTNDEEEKKRNPGLRSKITVATAGTSETGRSGNFTNLHVSEVAFFPDAARTLTALLQCVPDEKNTLVVLESTANGVGGYFYDMWHNAVNGKNEFTPIFLAWFVDRTYRRDFEDEEIRQEFMNEVDFDYTNSTGHLVKTEEALLMEQFDLTYEQMYWRKWVIANKCGGSLDVFKQEYPSTPEEAFIASGRPRFDQKALKQYEIKCTNPSFLCDLQRKGKNVSLVTNEKGFVRIWEKPQSGNLYTIGIDVAEGLLHGDYSNMQVLDSNCDIVAEWHGHIDPDLLGKEAVKLGLYYNEAYLSPESNNHGRTTIKSILDEEYWNIYYQKMFDKITEQVTTKVGWSTNMKTKAVAIDKLAEYVREQCIGIKNKELIKELYTYIIDERGRTNAQRGCYDDRVMALAIGLQAFLEGKGEDYMPEITEGKANKTSNNFDVPEIIDPLFETDGNKIECS